MKTIETINGQDLQAKYEALDREIEARLDAAHKSNARGDEARAMYGKIDELKKEFKATFKEMQNHPFVGQVEYDSARCCVRCQAPFNTCGTVDLAAYIVNVNPLITPPAYKVTDPEFIKNHKMDI